ncbi:MAG: prolyl oligopeptidase family serine peptidase [Planctomycetota bacterium]
MHVSTWSIPSGGANEPQRRVRGRCALPAGATRVPWLLVAPGYTASVAHTFYPALLQRCVAAGFGCVQLAFSGTGLGEDLETVAHPDLASRATYGWELDDLEAAWRHAASGALSNRLDLGRATLLGHSRGGGMAVVHAAEHQGRYTAVVTWNAIHAILRFSPLRLQVWRAKGNLDVMHWSLGRRIPLDVAVLEHAEAHRARYDIQAAAARLEAPLLVVQSEDDDAVTPAEGRELAAAGGAELRLVAGADHWFGMRGRTPAPTPEFGAAVDATLGWLGARLTR